MPETITVQEAKAPLQTIFGLVPSKSNSYRMGKKFFYKTQALTNYEDAFFIQCDKYRNKNIKGYFEFHMAVYYPNQRSDIDGSLKVVLDCLARCKAIENDNRCVRLVIDKFLDKANPRIEFKIFEV